MTATILDVHINGGRRNVFTSLKNLSQSKMRGVIKFLLTKGSFPKEVFAELVLDDSKDVMNKG